MLRDYIPALKYGNKIHSSEILGGGVLANYLAGNAYYVMATTATKYEDFNRDYGIKYRDGSQSVHNTVDSAIGACVADRGDVIVVTPGHTETITASSINLDIAGITVICLGTGENTPYFTYSAAASEITVAAADVSWYGGHFYANYLDVASAFQVDAAKDFHLEGATFEDKSSILNFLSCVTTTTTDNDADGLEVINNKWLGLNTTPLAFISILGNTIKPNIQHNFVDLDATSGGEFITLAAKAATQTRIMHNQHIVVGASGTTTGIFLTGSGTASSGVVAYNLCASLDTTSELIATAGTKLTFFENYYTGTADKSGKLWPVVDAA
jgi:hypothetical protein